MGEVVGGSIADAIHWSEGSFGRAESGVREDRAGAVAVCGVGDLERQRPDLGAVRTLPGKAGWDYISKNSKREFRHHGLFSPCQKSNYPRYRLLQFVAAASKAQGL